MCSPQPSQVGLPQFSHSMRLHMTWGENITIMVLDAEGGCDVEVSGVGKVGGQVQQATTLLQTFGKLFERISVELTEGR